MTLFFCIDDILKLEIIFHCLYILQMRTLFIGTRSALWKFHKETIIMSDPVIIRNYMCISFISICKQRRFARGLNTVRRMLSVKTYEQAAHNSTCVARILLRKRTTNRTHLLCWFIHQDNRSPLISRGSRK